MDVWYPRFDQAASQNEMPRAAGGVARAGRRTAGITLYVALRLPRQVESLAEPGRTQQIEGGLLIAIQAGDDRVERVLPAQAIIKGSQEVGVALEGWQLDLRG